MIVSKIFLSIIIVFCATRLGIELSKKYVLREKELCEIKNAFKIMETKIRYTYEPLKDIFLEISNTICSENVSNIFKKSGEKIENNPAKATWEDAIENTKLNISKEDKEILKGFGKLLGKTDKLRSNK